MTHFSIVWIFNPKVTGYVNLRISNSGLSPKCPEAVSRRECRGLNRTARLLLGPSGHVSCDICDGYQFVFVKRLQGELSREYTMCRFRASWENHPSQSGKDVGCLFFLWSFELQKRLFFFFFFERRNNYLSSRLLKFLFSKSALGIGLRKNVNIQNKRALLL